MCRRSRCALVAALAGAALAAAVLPTPVRAQSVQGTLLRADSMPAAGVIVVATRGARDSVLARTMTNGNGRYVLTLTPGPVALRALRIGHRPHVFAEFTVTAGMRRDARTVLPNDPIVLAAVTTEASSSCRQSGTAGANVATVFEEARKALLASTLKSGDGDPLARLSVFEQARSVGNRGYSQPKLEFQEGVTLKPFQSLKPDSLAKVGYMVLDLTSAEYYAPDAEVLLSESFTSTHCLGLSEGKDATAGLIGLTFRPQQLRRNYVDVRGTLWLDRATNELRRMEYSYDGLPITMQRADPGGDVEFTRLADGTWFVSKWEIRMPRMTLSPGTPQLVGLWVKGGEVWWIRRGRSLLYTNGRDEPAKAEQLAATAAASAERDSAAADFACTPANPGDPGGLLVGTVVDERGAPLADAVVTVEWKGNFNTAGRGITWEMQGLSAITGRDGSFGICGVPTGQMLSVAAQYGTRKTPKAAVQIAPSMRVAARVELRVVGVRGNAPAKGVVVRVRSDAGAAIAHALVEVEGGRGRVTDDSGRVFLDAAPDTLRMAVRRIGHAPFSGRIGRTASGEFAVTLRPLAQTLAAVHVVERGVKTPLELSGFYDRVLRAQRGAFNADFITPEELETRRGARPSDLFQGRRFVAPARTPGGRPRTFLQGRGRCNMTVYVDGQLLRPDSPRGVIAIDEQLDANAISAIEIYASAANAPAELIPLVGAVQEAACGIVAIWTGSRR
jgi:hypothetical protein